LACTLALAAYIPYRHAYTGSEEPASPKLEALSANLLVNGAEQILQAQQQEPPPPTPPPPPPPPVFPGTAPMRHSRPEVPRALTGTTEEDLKGFEKYLPEGAHVYTFPVGEASLAAAVITADLDGDGRDETILVHNERKPTPEEGSLPLTLSVLVGEGNRLKLRASTDLLGGVLFEVSINGFRTHLAVHDVTGDGRPEIIVVPATGASVGGWLRVLSFDGSTLHELARIGGHFFRVRSKGAGKPALITGRWNGEKGTRSYEWNDRVFEETAMPVKESR
ncbi:MAG: hypothetical protein AABN34_13460, partial [Acidobacteriota bacterium]